MLSFDNLGEASELERGTWPASAALRGFRPPGGELTERTPDLLREAGFDWCSPVGTEPSERDGLSFLPFEWELVDAYHLMPKFGALLEPSELAARLGHELERPRQRTLILHPFLMLDDEWWAGVRSLLGRIAQLALGRRAWVVPGAEFVDWMRG